MFLNMVNGVFVDEAGHKFNLDFTNLPAFKAHLPILFTKKKLSSKLLVGKWELWAGANLRGAGPPFRIFHRAWSALKSHCLPAHLLTSGLSSPDRERNYLKAPLTRLCGA
jgi:hypothetical protein